MRGKVQFLNNFPLGELKISSLVSFQTYLIPFFNYYFVNISLQPFHLNRLSECFPGLKSTFTLRCQSPMRTPCIKLKCCQARRSINGHEELEINISCLYRLHLNRKKKIIFKIILVHALLQDINEIFHDKTDICSCVYVAFLFRRQAKRKVSSFLTKFSSFLDEQCFSFQEKEL